ncbi:MAG: hypothetical protein AAFP20_20045 [Cyanobacteria bacterium J06614_10]
MAYFIVVWLGLLVSCMTVGCGLLHGLQALWICQRGYRVVLAVWLGLSVLSILLLAIAMVSPLTPVVGVGAIVTAVLLCLSIRAVRAEMFYLAAQLSGRAVWVFAVSSVAIAIFTTQRITWIDTGLYHYGAIQWLATHGTTPGLALINRMFGFVSAWFALSAPFNPPQMQGRASAVLNGFILLLLTLQIVLSAVLIKEQLATLNSDDWSPLKLPQASALFLLISSCLSFVLVTQTSFLSAIAVSASPDIAVILLTIIAGWSMLVIGESDRTGNFSMPSGWVRSLVSADLIPVVLAAAAVSIKLTALPLLVVVVGFYVFRQLTILRVITGGIFSVVLLLPFLWTQTLISGCPLYPSTFACLDLPWTLAPERVKDLASNTHGWGKWFGQPPIEANRPLWLIQQWIGSNQSSKLMFVLLLISVVSGIYFLIRANANFSPINLLPASGLYGLVGLSWLGTTFVMLKAPLFRFGMGYFLLLPTLVLVTTSYALIKTFVAKLRCSARRRFSTVFTLAMLSAGIALTVGMTGDILRKDALKGAAPFALFSRILIASPLPSVNTYTRTINGIPYIVTLHERSQCWSATLPCVSLLHPEVKLRRPDIGIRGGFVGTVNDAKI